MAAHLHELLIWLATGSSKGDFGSALATLHSALKWAIGSILTLIYARYIGVLGAGSEPEGTRERQAYDDLRESLSGGNLAARLYARWLRVMLDRVDRFFGDAGMADRTLFPHAFGLRKPAPLWTAPAFDRCLLLALIYPIVTIFAIWAISGDVGPAEAALRLPPSLPGWERGLLIVSIIFVSGAAFRASRATGWRSLAWCASTLAVGFAVVTSVVAATAAGAGILVAVAVAVAVVAVFGIRVAAAVGSAIGSAIVVAYAFVFAVAVALKVATPIAVALAAVALAAVALAAVAVVTVFGGAFAVRRRQGVFLSFFVATMIVSCLVAANLLSPLESWRISGPLLLFLGLLTLLNAPFDWASLGLTRALLRRGLELGGWAPYFLAFVDAALAACVIVALTLAMVIGVQTFDELAVSGGGKAVLPLEKLFDGIAANPSAPEYWWVYALLVSSMIPSLVNLVIGGTSLLRGLPGLPSLLLRKIPEDGNVPAFDRAWIAAVLTTQIALGAALGIAAQSLLAVGIIVYVMPFFGLELLDMARGVAAFDLPMRAWQLFTHLL